MHISKLAIICRKTLSVAAILMMPVLVSCSLFSPAATATPVVTVTMQASATPTIAPTGTPTPVLTPTLGARVIWRNSRIAFASNRSGRFQIYLIKPDGTALTQLTDSDGENHSPAWTTDAKHIVFASTRDGNSEIYIMEPDGSGQKNLSHDISDDRMPVALPNDRLAFVSNRKGRDRVIIMDLQGENINSFPASSIEFTDKMVCLVPFIEDWLFFTSEEQDGLRRTRVLDISTGHVMTPDELVGPPDRSCPLLSGLLNSDWSMFVTNRDGHDEIYGYRQSNLVDVQFTKGSEPSLGGSRSSDQGWLAFYSRRTGNWDLFIMGIQGKNQWNITNDPADDIQPSWEPY